MSKVWYYLPLWCVAERQEDGTYVATIPDIDDLEGQGDSAQEAAKDLALQAFFTLRM